jgi:hypothetical protein
VVSPSCWRRSKHIEKSSMNTGDSMTYPQHFLR